MNPFTALAGQLEEEAETAETWDGNEQAVLLRVAAALRALVNDRPATSDITKALADLADEWDRSVAWLEGNDEPELANARWDGARRIQKILQTDPGPAGYVIVERQMSGPRAGRLDADWDGEIHEDRATAEAELAKANAPFSDDQTQTPDDHWKLYEVREVKR